MVHSSINVTFDVYGHAATGGIIGALTRAGVPEEDASQYAEGIRRGGTLVSVRIPEQDRSRLETILDQSSVNLRDRSAGWQKSGWTGFDAASPPLALDDIRRERELNRTEAGLG